MSISAQKLFINSYLERVKTIKRPLYIIENIDKKRLNLGRPNKYDYNKTEVRQICLDLGIPICPLMEEDLILESLKNIPKTRFIAWLHGPDPYDLRLNNDPKSKIYIDEKYGIISNDQKDLDDLIYAINFIENEIGENITNNNGKYYNLDHPYLSRLSSLSKNFVNRDLKIYSKSPKAKKYFNCQVSSTRVQRFHEEKDVQVLIEQLYKGTHFTLYTLHGRKTIDVLTETEIIEIKCLGDRNKAITQVLGYATYYEKMTGVKLQPVIILYDDGTQLTPAKVENMKNICKSEGIILRFFDGLEIKPFEANLLHLAYQVHNTY